VLLSITTKAAILARKHQFQASHTNHLTTAPPEDANSQCKRVPACILLHNNYQIRTADETVFTASGNCFDLGSRW